MVQLCSSGIMDKYNMSAPEHIDLFIDWSVNEIFTKDFNLKVVGHYRNDEYKCILDETYPIALTTLRAALNLHDLDLIRGSEIKTLITGYDLFISPRTTYRYFL